jgi:predicted PurR-regulated permease PerM
MAWPLRVLLIGGVLAALYLGRDLFAPLALAMLLTVASLPLVTWLERVRIPRIAAVLLVLLLLLSLVTLLLYVVVSQALALANALPGYETVLREKLGALSEGSGPIDRVVRLMNRLAESVGTTEASPAATVVLAAAPQAPLASVMALATVVLAPAATLAITVLLMAFILAQREDVRDRVLRLAGLHDMHRTTVAMTDAASRVGRFLLMQAGINAVFGASMGIGLWLIGLPNAPLWGVMGFALRFIPYLGAPLSVLFPLLLAFATTEGWNTVLLVLALFLVVDVAVSYVLEPWLYSASIGITPLALVLSSTFWVVLWGPVGLIVAPAFTACMVILGRHVPAFGFLEILLGNRPPLPSPARFYQRLLAGDPIAAARLLVRESERLGNRAALEQLVLPAVARISGDRGETGFGPALAVHAARTLLRTLETVADPADEHGDVAVLPVGGALDRAAAATLVVTLQDAGLSATLSPTGGGVHPVAVLVAADPPAPQRLARALREANRMADVVRFFSPTDEAEAALNTAATHVPRAMTLDALLAEVVGQVDAVLNPQPEPNETVPTDSPPTDSPPTGSRQTEPRL